MWDLSCGVTSSQRVLLCFSGLVLPPRNVNKKLVLFEGESLCPILVWAFFSTKLSDSCDTQVLVWWMFRLELYFALYSLINIGLHLGSYSLGILLLLFLWDEPQISS